MMKVPKPLERFQELQALPDADMELVRSRASDEFLAEMAEAQKNGVDLRLRLRALTQYLKMTHPDGHPRLLNGLNDAPILEQEKVNSGHPDQPVYTFNSKGFICMTNKFRKLLAEFSGAKKDMYIAAAKAFFARNPRGILSNLNQLPVGVVAEDQKMAKTKVYRAASGKVSKDSPHGPPTTDEDIATLVTGTPDDPNFLSAVRSLRGLPKSEQG